MVEATSPKSATCWRCDRSIEGHPLPLSTYAECDACGAPLHVCLMCEFHNPVLSTACEETRAEMPRSPEVRNFCGYLSVSGKSRSATREGATAARAALDELFGDTGPAPGAETPNDALEALFSPKDKKSE